MVRHVLFLALSALAFSACTADVHVDPGPPPYDGPGHTLDWMFDDADVTTYDDRINESSFSVNEARFDTLGCYLDTFNGLTKDEIVEQMDLAGDRPGTIEQLLAYGHDYKGETQGEWTVALGSSLWSYDDTWPVYERSSVLSAELDLTSGDDSTGFSGEEVWDDGTLFIACP